MTASKGNLEAETTGRSVLTQRREDAKRKGNGILEEGVEAALIVHRELNPGSLSQSMRTKPGKKRIVRGFIE